MVLSTLDPQGSWTTRLLPLNVSKDLHLPRREDDDGLDEDERELRGRGAKFRGRKQSGIILDMAGAACRRQTQ